MAANEVSRNEATGVSDSALKEKTGRTWPEWFAQLDLDGAAKLDPRGIARLIFGKYGVSSWWRQIIAIAYARARDLRETGERAAELGVKASRTINAPVRALYVVVHDAAKQPATWVKARFDQLHKALEKKTAT